MLQLMCLEHPLTTVVDARARVNATTWLGSFAFGTKPYAIRQRPSGAPPGS